MSQVDPQSADSAQLSGRARVRVFIDYWNFQLTINEIESKARGIEDYRFRIDWRAVGPILAGAACELVSVQLPQRSFDGVIIYASYNPRTSDGTGFHHWATTWLDRQPGVSVICLERRPRALPRCPTCHRTIEHCPYDECRARIVATVEKGVDTFIATDMIRLAWENAFDVAVLASSDADLVPAVQFLNQKGRKVVQAGFPPRGVDLATSCWASFDVRPLLPQIERRMSSTSS